LATVSYVEYTLHPTFPNSDQRVDRTTDTRYPFGLTATGWGVFPVAIKVVFKSGQIRYLSHMLRFVAASTQNACGSPFKLLNRHTQILADPRFKDPVYVYVDAIHTEWTKNPPTLTMFYGYSGALSTDEYVPASRFGLQIKNVPPETKWSLKIQHEGDAIQFRYGASYYLLTVKRVNVHLGDKNYLDVQVCEKQPPSAR
jgi:hypothetical protein